MYLNELLEFLSEQVKNPEPKTILKALDFTPEGWQQDDALLAEEAVQEAVLIIRKSLQVLRERYVRNGRTLVPAKPISGVLPDFSLMFGRMDYHGNPLAVFEAHPEAYDGLNRTELFHFDPAMYRALKRAGQLEQAIPEKLKFGRAAIKKPTPDHVIDDILKSYQQGFTTREQFEEKLSSFRKVTNGVYQRPLIALINPKNGEVEIKYSRFY